MVKQRDLAELHRQESAEDNKWRNRRLSDWGKKPRIPQHKEEFNDVNVFIDNEHTLYIEDAKAGELLASYKIKEDD